MTKPKKRTSITKKAMGLCVVISAVPVVALTAVSSASFTNDIRTDAISGNTTSVNMINNTVGSTMQALIDKAIFSINNFSAYESEEHKLSQQSLMEMLPQADSNVLSNLVAYASETGLDTISSHPSERGVDMTDQAWFQESMANPGSVYVSTPWYSEEFEQDVITIATTIGDGSGVYAVNAKFSAVTNALAGVEYGEDGHVFIINNEGKVVTHKNHKSGENVKEDALISPIFTDEDNSYTAVDENNKEWNTVFANNEATGWKIGFSYSENDVMASVKASIFKVLASGLAIVLLGTAIGILVVRKLVQPTLQMREASEKLSTGDLTVRSNVASNDEAEDTSVAFNKMAENFQNVLRSVQRISGNLTGSSDSLAASTDENVSAIRQITSSIQEISNGSNEQLQSTQDVSNEIHSISDQIQQMTENIGESREFASSTAVKADDGVKVINEAIEQINIVKETAQHTEKDFNVLVEKSNEIMKFNAIISDIAQQTNLLSLNAAIEAAHAGERGKGFAVVADEIRKLAEQSNEAAKQIGVLIEDIRTSTQNASESMSESVNSVDSGSQKVMEAGKSFEEIREQIGALSGRMNEISDFVSQITDGTNNMVKSFAEVTNISEEITGSIDSVASITQQQGASMEDISRASSELAEMANELQKMFANFKIEEK